MFPDGKEKIGVVSETANELYLFNDNGSLYHGFPLSGKTGFSIGDLNNEGVLNLITGSSDNSIYLYQLE
jgi:PPE-repeat protein